MKKRIFSIMLAALMLLAIVPFSVFADYKDKEVELWLGFGTWNGSEFSDGRLTIPYIWGKVPDVTGLKAAVVTPGESEKAEDQTSPYQISNVKWIQGVTKDQYGDDRFDWTAATTLSFDIHQLSGNLPQYDTGDSSKFGLDTSKIKLKLIGGTDGVELRASDGVIQSGGIRWKVFITWTKRICIYSQDRAYFLVEGLPFSSYKPGDGFPSYSVPVGEMTNYYTVETNWYYALGESGKYTRGAKVSETTIQPGVAYDCELTIKLKSDAPVAGTGHYITSDGSVECVLRNVDNNELLPGYFKWGMVDNVNDNPDNKTLTVRKFFTYNNVLEGFVIDGITEPEPGKKPFTSGIFADPSSYLVINAVWSGPMTDDGKFLPGKDYTLTFDLQATEALDIYKFEALTPVQRPSFATANIGTVTSVEYTSDLPQTFRITIAYRTGLESAGSLVIILDGSEGKEEGKCSYNPGEFFGHAMDYTLQALDPANGGSGFLTKVISSVEMFLDVDKDGTWDVVMKGSGNSRNFEVHPDCSVKGIYAIDVTEDNRTWILNNGGLRYNTEVLFYFPGTCPHEHLTFQQAVIATPEKDGTKECWKCDQCHHYFTDDKATEEILSYELVVPFFEGEHEHIIAHFDAVEATPEKDGNIEYWRCVKCGKYFSDAEGKNEITAESVIVKFEGESKTELPSENPPHMRLGDVNDDNAVNAKDVVALMKHLVGKTPKDFNKHSADVHNDGVLNAKDVTDLMKGIVRGDFAKD